MARSITQQKLQRDTKAQERTNGNKKAHGQIAYAVISRSKPTEHFLYTSQYLKSCHSPQCCLYFDKHYYCFIVVIKSVKFKALYKTLNHSSLYIRTQACLKCPSIWDMDGLFYVGLLVGGQVLSPVLCCLGMYARCIIK